MPFRAAILTISDKGARGEREDTSGAAIRELLTTIDATVERYEVIADEQQLISERLQDWADSGAADFIVTTGGTGLGPRDVTPQATLAVIDYEVPGLAEAMRAEGLKHTPMSMLSRAVAGVRWRALIINLPGSPKGVRENLSAILAGPSPRPRATKRRTPPNTTPLTCVCYCVGQNGTKMRIDILTLFPAMFRGPFDESIIKRAVDSGVVSIHIHDIRQWATVATRSPTITSTGAAPVWS